MKRLFMIVLVLALAMPCLAETADAGQRVAVPVAEEAAPIAEEAAPDAEEVELTEDAEIIAAPVEADVPEAAAELGDAPQMAFKLFEPDGEMTWASVKDALQAGDEVTLTNDVTRGDGDETINISHFECTLDLNGYTLDNGESDEPAIRVDGEGEDNTKFTITDSSTGNTGKILCRSSYPDKAAIKIRYGASVTLAGGSIANANANPDWLQGYGVYCDGNNSRFNMEGGTISAYGTGVMCDEGVAFTMSGGTITGCDEGVKLDADSAMTMTGGAIAQNQNQGVNMDPDAALSVSGSPVITGEEGWWSYGVGLSEGGAITVTGALGEGARIGVSMVSPPGVCVVGADGYTLTGDDLAHFSSDSPDYAVIMNAEGKGALVKQPSGGDTPNPPPSPSPSPDPALPTPTTVSATKKNSAATVGLGAACQLDLGGATGRKFKSSNKKVATVDQTGLVTLHKAGKAKITFKVGKKTRTVKLKVVDPTVPGSITIAPVDRAVKKGDTVALTAVLPEGTTSGIKWKSSNKKVAKVDGNGVVTFLKRGKVTITATATRGKKKASVRFRVAAAAK